MTIITDSIFGQYSAQTPPGNRILLLENSRTYTAMLHEAIEQRTDLKVSVAHTLAEANALLEQHSDWFMALTGLVVADGSRSEILHTFSRRNLPAIIVSGVYDEDLRQHLLQKEVIDYVLKNAPDSLDYLIWLVKRLERNRHISALVVDDSLSARSYITALLRGQGYRVAHVENGDEAIAAVEGDPNIRLAIIDQEMPNMDGVELTRRLRQLRTRDRMAIIGFSGRTNATFAPRFLKSGANDYVRKPFSREEFFCRVSQNIEQLELIGSLQDLAARDYLTDLPNRRSFIERTEALMQGDADQPVTIAMIDVDHFKRINDQFGHASGDRALRMMAEVLQNHTRSGDISGRLGGEEFGMALIGLSPAQAHQHLDGLRQAVEALHMEADGKPLQFTVSIGACCRSAEHPDLHKLLSEADRHLYLAKAGGRNQLQGI